MPGLSCFAASVAAKQDVMRLAIEAPKPEYPNEARLHQQRGSGVFLLRTNIQSGRVTQVIVARTTGHKSLDEAAVNALRQWRFKPGALIHRDITKPRLTPPVSKEQCLVLVPVIF